MKHNISGSMVAIPPGTVVHKDETILYNWAEDAAAVSHFGAENKIAKLFGKEFCTTCMGQGHDLFVMT